jgi:hypothetical protein
MEPMAKSSKVRSTPIATFEGYTVYAKLQRAKRHGRDRLWFQIRYTDGDQSAWRVASCLTYPHALDVRFERDQVAAGTEAPTKRRAARERPR